MSWQGIQITTAATVEPVTAADVKSNLRIDGTEQDSMISSLIPAARISLEKYLNRTIAVTGYTAVFDRFCDVLTLPYSPCTEVTSIKYLDIAGVEQTLSTSVYRVDLVSQPARISLAYSRIWPTIQPVKAAIKIAFTAGYATCPAPIKQAIIMLVSDMFEHSNVSAEVTLNENKVYKFLLAAYQMPEIQG